MWNIEKRHIVALEIAFVALLTLFLGGGYYYYHHLQTPLDTVSVVIFDDKNDDLDSIEAVAQFQELPITTITSTINGEITSVLIKKGDAITAGDPVLTAINSTLEPTITYKKMPLTRYKTIEKQATKTPKTRINTVKIETYEVPQTDIYNDMMRDYNTKKADLEASIQDIDKKIAAYNDTTHQQKTLINSYCKAFGDRYNFMLRDIYSLFLSDGDITNPHIQALGNDDTQADYALSKSYKKLLDNSTICKNDCQICAPKLINMTHKYLTDAQMYYKNNSSQASDDTINTAYYKIEAVKNGLQKLLDKMPHTIQNDTNDDLEAQKKELTNALQTLQKPVLEYDTKTVVDDTSDDITRVDAVKTDYETVEEVYYEEMPDVEYEQKDALEVVKTAFSGVVEEVLLEKGMVKEGDEIAKIRHADDVQMVLVALDEQQTDMLLYATGATLQLSENSIPITLEQLQMGLKRTKNGSTIRLEIPTLNGIITGQTAIITINLSATPLPTIPRTSIITTQNGHKVRIAELQNDDTYLIKERIITVQKLYNDVAEVSDGLAMGDMVLEFGGDYEPLKRVLIRYKEITKDDVDDVLPAPEATQNAYMKPQKIDTKESDNAVSTPLEPLSTDRPASSFGNNTTPAVLQKKLQTPKKQVKEAVQKRGIKRR